MISHVKRATLLAYIDGDTSTDRLTIAAHLADCRVCRRELDELCSMASLLRDAAIFDFLDAREKDRDRTFARSDITVTHRRLRMEEARAETFFGELMRLPIEEWPTVVEARPQERTESMVQHLMHQVQIELNRRPTYALQLIDVAEDIASTLNDPALRRCAGDCWKHRSNALRHLGRYSESLDAAEIAEFFYRSLTLGHFDVGQALYTRACTLFKMTKYTEALQVLGSASDTLRDFGNTVPLAKTLMLAAAIRFEQGNVAQAQATWREVVPMLDQFEDRIELARVRVNLAECSMRLDRPAEALAVAQAAARVFADLSMDTERIRAEWTIGAIRLALGEHDAALELFYRAAVAFQSLGMAADAGFVKLDITEELLHRQEWRQAAICARELIELFTSAGVTLACVTALSYLRTAVEGERATPSLVQYVREYVTGGHGPFLPPVT